MGSTTLCFPWDLVCCVYGPLTEARGFRGARDGRVFLRVTGGTNSVRILYNSVFSKGARRLVEEVGETRFTGRGVTVCGPYVSMECSGSRIISRSTRDVPSVPVSSPTGVLRLSRNIRIMNISRTGFFSRDLVSIILALTGGNIEIVVTNLSRSFLNGPFNPVPTLVTITRSIRGMRTVYIGYNDPTGRSRHLSGDDSLIILKRASVCRPLYHRYCGTTVTRR